LKKDFREKAREEAAEKLPDAKKMGREVVRRFLMRILKLEGTDTEVIVE
jgi:hypothetical protein